MKKVLLLSTAVIAAFSSFAQSRRAHLASEFAGQPSVTAAKGAGNGDTILRGNISSTDTLSNYRYDAASPNDSGFVTGVNVYNDKGFAERFDIKGSDSSVSVLGAALYLNGTASATSTKSINIRAWSQGTKTLAGGTTRPHLYFNGKPNAVLNTLTVPLTQLRKANGRIDSFRLFRFATPTAYISDSFFVGFDMTYTFSSLAGDTVSLLATKDGNRHTPVYLLSGADTLLNVQNAVQFSDGSWNDEFQQNAGIFHHFIVYALFRVRIPNGVNGITRNDLTVYGAIPNPANNTTSLKLSLTHPADVAVQIVDMAGRTVQTANVKNAATGELFIPVNTAMLANGTYNCLVRTSNGDAMGVQMVVAH